MKKLQRGLFLACFLLFAGLCSVFYQWISYQQTLHENPSSNIYPDLKILTKEEKEIQSLMSATYQDWEHLSSIFGYLSLLFTILLAIIGILIWQLRSIENITDNE